jgi:putative MFS transporter
MALIVLGLGSAVWGLLPPRRRPGEEPAEVVSARFAALDGAKLTPAHWILVVVLTFGLVVDTMKPASLGFVVPGMEVEYGISRGTAALLPWVAISGTVIGSLVWGYLADIFGRRSTIMLSTLIYVATSICGFMPSFGWNLVMCFFMGASAGGMLPTVYSLMSESMPADKRGWLIVGQSGLGAALGYLAASGGSTLLAPHYSWRILWLMGAPTGLILLGLSRWIPESPRFLLARGRVAEATAVMRRYGIQSVPATPTVAVAGAPARLPLSVLFRSPLVRRTLPILLYGVGWGIVNWAFITFLPTLLQNSATGAKASELLFASSVFALPTTVIAAIAYAKWSSKGTLVVCSGCTFVVLVLFAVLGVGNAGGSTLVVMLSVLLASSNGMIAALAPYATEVYPTQVRAAGSGLAAAAGKAGGLFGPLLVTTAPEIGDMALVCALPVGVAALVLLVTGMETAGRPLIEADAVTAGS